MMADTSGQRPTNITYTSGQPVTSDISASQPAPAFQSGQHNDNNTLHNARAGSGTPSTPILITKGPSTAPPPPLAAAVSSASVAPTAPLAPSQQPIHQTPLVPSQQPVHTPSYPQAYAQERQPFPPQQVYQEQPRQHIFPTLSQPAAPIQVQQRPITYSLPQPQPQPAAPRPLIVDPPRKVSTVPAMIPPQPKQSNGFPSPGRDYGVQNHKFNDDLSRITFSFQQAIPEAVRRAVRDNWEKCLLGSEFHQAFVLNAAVHHSSSTPGIQNRAIRDFGAVMVSNCKQEIVEKWSTRDIDDVAPALLAKASNAFLDQCLALRLQTIDAKPLIEALAKAERLGYNPDDILVNGGQQETVIPNGHVPVMTPPARAPSLETQRARPDQLQCLKCFRTFTKKCYYDYHLDRKVCTKIPPTAEGFRHSCPNCGRGFTHVSGMKYHVEKGVCESGNRMPTPTASPITPAATASQRVQHQATPSSQVPATRPPMAAGMRAAASAAVRVGPYAHLSEAEFVAMNEELRQAEIQYAPRFHEAEAVQDPDERQRRLDSLRNTFGTKQSIIRKKYNVKLRERRTKAEIQAERERMGLRDGSGARSTPDARTPKQFSHSQVPVPTYGQTHNSSSWTAANKRPSADTPREEPSKRRRTDDGNSSVKYKTPHAPQPPASPTKKVSEMAGGLTASADAAMHDPTLPSPQRASAALSSQPALTYQQSGARVEVHLPAKPAPARQQQQNRTGQQQHDSSTDNADTEAHPPEAQIEYPSVTMQYDGADDEEEDEDEEDNDDARAQIKYDQHMAAVNHGEEDRTGEEYSDEEGKEQEDEINNAEDNEGLDEEDKDQQSLYANGRGYTGYHSDNSDSVSDSDSDDEDIPPSLPPVSSRPATLNYHRMCM